MQPSQIKIFVVFYTCLLIFGLLTGCIDKEQSSEIEDILSQYDTYDQPSILPNWTDGDYHDYYNTMDLLQEFHIYYPEL